MLSVAAVVVLAGIAAAILIWQSNGDNVKSVSDDFARADSTAQLGRPWKTLSGGWGITGGEAYLARPSAGSNLAVVSMESGDGRIEASVPSATEGAGIAFRVVDARNYWAVVAAPGYGTWNILRVEGGHTTFVGNTGLTLQRATRASIGVRLTGDNILVTVNGNPAAGRKSDVFQSAPLVGLVGIGTVDHARWGAFAARGSG